MSLDAGDVLGLAVGLVIVDKVLDHEHPHYRKKKKKKKEDSIWGDL